MKLYHKSLVIITNSLWDIPSLNKFTWCHTQDYMRYNKDFR